MAKKEDLLDFYMDPEERDKRASDELDSKMKIKKKKPIHKQSRSACE